MEQGESYSGVIQLVSALLAIASLLCLSSCQASSNNTNVVKALEIPVESGGVDEIAWSPDGAMLASGNGKSIILWSVPDYEIISTFEWDPAFVVKPKGLVWSPDGTQLISYGLGGHHQIWDVTTGSMIASASRNASLRYPFSDMAWSSDGSLLAGYVQDIDRGISVIHFIDTNQFELLTTIPAKSIEAWNPVGNLVANYNNNENEAIQIWDVSTSQMINKFQGHRRKSWPDFSGPLIWGPDGTMVASFGGGGLVKIWLAMTGQEVLSLDSHAGVGSDVVWSPDGNCLAINNWHSIQIWDVTTGQRKATYSAPESFNFGAPEWSSDSRKLAVATIPLNPERAEEDQLWVWDVSTDQVLVNNQYQDVVWYMRFEWHPNQPLLAAVVSPIEVEILEFE